MFESTATQPSNPSQITHSHIDSDDGVTSASVSLMVFKFFLVFFHGFAIYSATVSS